jgi:hypothetical protein
MAFTGNYTCNAFLSGLLDGTYNFASDTFKIALYTNAAALTNTTDVYTTDGEVVATGYTAGGETLIVSQLPIVNGINPPTAYISFSNVSWTSALTARGALIYKDDGVTYPTVCVLDFGNDKTSTTTFTVQFPAATNTSAIIRIA